MSSQSPQLFGGAPSLLTGTEPALVAEIPGAGGRWTQVHFNLDVMRRFFHLEPGKSKSITLERINSSGEVQSRTLRQLVFSTENSNAKLEFDFSPVPSYPPSSTRPLLVVVEASYLTFRFRMVMPGESGYPQLTSLLSAGPPIGRGVKRRLVTLDEVEAFWPKARLRGE